MSLKNRHWFNGIKSFKHNMCKCLVVCLFFPLFCALWILHGCSGGRHARGPFSETHTGPGQNLHYHCSEYLLFWLYWRLPIHLCHGETGCENASTISYLTIDYNMQYVHLSVWYVFVCRVLLGLFTCLQTMVINSLKPCFLQPPQSRWGRITE